MSNLIGLFAGLITILVMIIIMELFSKNEKQNSNEVKGDNNIIANGNYNKKRG